MLSAIRQRLSSFIVIALMGLLILSFAVWGIGDIFRAGGGSAIASIGETRVTTTAFSREFQNEVNRLRQQIGPDFTAADARGFGLHRQVLARMVSRASFDEAASDLGLRASDEQVRAYIADNEAFYNSFGDFDRAIYEGLLQRIGFTVPEFEEISRLDLSREQLLTSLSAPAHVPNALVRQLYRFSAEQRTFDFARVPVSSVEEAGDVTEEALRAYYSNNDDRFMAPEYRSLSFILVRASDLTDDSEISEQALRDYYDFNVDEFVEPERRAVDQIVLFEEREARDVYDALEAGESFEAVAERLADLAPDELDLGELTERDLADSVSNVAAQSVFEIEPGQYTAPQQSAFGWHILRPTTIVDGSEQSFDEARDDIAHKLREEAAVDRLFDVANTMEAELAGGAPLEEVAAKVGVALTRVDAIDPAGRGPDGEPVEGLPADDDFINEAFRMDTNAEPVIREAGADAYYALQVTNITPPALRPFEEARDEVAARYHAEDRLKRARDRAEQLAGRASDGFAAQARDGEEAQEGVTLTRDPALGEGGISANIREAVFETTPGDVTVTETAGGDGYLVIRVTDRAPGDPGAAGQQLDGLADQIRRQYTNDVLAAFQNHVERNKGFTLNEQLLEDTLTQMLDRPF